MKKIFYKATKVIGKPIKVEFYTKGGKRVAFKPNTKVSKPLKVKFYEKENLP